MTIQERIEINPRIMMGKADLLDAYPRLTREDIHAAMRYAADALSHEEVVFVGGTPQE